MLFRGIRVTHRSRLPREASGISITERYRVSGGSQGVHGMYKGIGNTLKIHGFSRGGRQKRRGDGLTFNIRFARV